MIKLLIIGMVIFLAFMSIMEYFEYHFSMSEKSFREWLIDKYSDNNI